MAVNTNQLPQKRREEFKQQNSDSVERYCDHDAEYEQRERFEEKENRKVTYT